jgi:8-oxo-dGTP diphosphatase
MGRKMSQELAIEPATKKEYQRPAVTVDVLLFTILDDELKLLLVSRGAEPYKGMLALPGGFVKMDESLDDAARRELREETGIDDVYIEQLYTFGAPNRDPRTRVVTVAYIALIDGSRVRLQASTDADDAAWFPVKKLPALAFDHSQIVETGISRLRSKLSYSSIAYSVLPTEFRLSELQKVYEIILDKPLDKRNFRKKMLSLKDPQDRQLIKPTGDKEISGAHRPAMLYRFTHKKLTFFE